MRHDLTGIPPLSRTDKLCCLALAGILVTTCLTYELTDGRALRATDAGDGTALVMSADANTIDFLPLVEAVEARREELYWAEVPLDQACRDALQEACETQSVPVSLALGVIEVESGFDPESVSREGAYGLCQLNPKYFPADLSPAENVWAGVAYLAEQIERYDGDIQAALRAYNKGYDDGDRQYARAVLDASEKWGVG